MPPLEQSSLSVFEIFKNLPNVSLNFIKFYSTNSVRKVYNFTLIVTRFDASLKHKSKVLESMKLYELVVEKISFSFVKEIISWIRK